MRKVLLATTALVAMGGVTAASADISIGGNYEWEYTSLDTGTTFGDDVNIGITATNAADNGMTFTARVGLTDGGIDYQNIKVDGDFGTLILGNIDDSAASAMDGVLGRNKDIETQVALGATDTAIGGTGIAYPDIIYMTPKMGGFQIGVGTSLTDADATANDGNSDAALTYSLSGISLYAGATSGRAVNQSNFGIGTTVAGLTIGVGSKSESGTSSAKSNDIGVNYTLANGIKIAALSANGTAADGTTKTKASNFGASYPIVPGVALNAETGKVAGANYSWIAVNMKF
jgi:hypothetical protein